MQAIEAEVAELLAQYAGQTVGRKRAVIHNGYLPERTLQTGLGDVPIKVPKVRDRSGQGVKFNNKLQKFLSLARSSLWKLIPGLGGFICRPKAVVFTTFCSSPVSLARLSMQVSAIRNCIVLYNHARRMMSASSAISSSKANGT